MAATNKCLAQNNKSRHVSLISRANLNPTAQAMMMMMARAITYFSYSIGSAHLDT
jgi:hypothetical protein